MDPSKYIGIPYEFRGDRFDGADCIGLIRLIYQEEFGIALPMYAPEMESPDKSMIMSSFTSATRTLLWEETSTPIEGDVVLINLFGAPFHCGVFLPGRQMLHVMEKTHSVIERLDSVRWGQRLAGFFRHKDHVSGH